MYGIGSLLTRAARAYPDRMAVADVTHSLSYSELNDRVNRIANFLWSIGLTKGSRIGFICDNCVEFAELWLATQKIGVVAVLLNYRAKKEEIARDVRRSNCNALFYSPKWKESISLRNISDSDVRYLISFGDSTIDGHINLDYICSVSDNTEPNVKIKETNFSTILYTSGSTGLSKGVIRTHRMVMAYAMQMAAEHEYYKAESICILSHSPLFHTGGLSMLMKSLALNGSYIGVNHLDPETYGSLIEKYKVTQLFLVPPVNIMRFADSDTIRKHDLSSVNFIWATGGKLSKDYVLAMLDLFPGARIKTSYGGTEFCAACSISYELTRDDIEKDPQLLESAGYLGQFADVRLVDENGCDVPAGQPGELWVSSPFVMYGYLDDPISTAEVLTDGWYHTGDVFRQDERGLYFFLDRISAMIKTGGENVYPNEVESVLRKHPSVMDCAVFSVPDPKWGEAVAAALVPEDGSIDLRDVHAFAKENLAGYRKPQYYTVLSELPKTASGKTDRRALKESNSCTLTSIKELE